MEFIAQSAEQHPAFCCVVHWLSHPKFKQHDIIYRSCPTYVRYTKAYLRKPPHTITPPEWTEKFAIEEKYILLSTYPGQLCVWCSIHKHISSVDHVNFRYVCAGVLCACSCAQWDESDRNGGLLVWYYGQLCFDNLRTFSTRTCLLCLSPAAKHTASIIANKARHISNAWMGQLVVLCICSASRQHNTTYKLKLLLREKWAPNANNHGHHALLPHAAFVYTSILYFTRAQSANDLLLRNSKRWNATRRRQLKTSKA